MQDDNNKTSHSFNKKERKIRKQNILHKKKHQWQKNNTKPQKNLPLFSKKAKLQDWFKRAEVFFSPVLVHL